ncbi:hypothetical protein SAMN05444273_105230 [Litoreibacter ascidiaceicola]|uniref:Membrane-bound lysozyme-inhibitor of c-type lysozyme n=1 Tax=Litoreibacter ascidiaceicola TaxID=1486859 RepID=A0A1M5AY40_9RHOB|nr:hypothetical protein [Litoreibacter ascidiaceicola]SHF35130.1 hypothetical protein SAMN05444273_105230 [Litoreibacter ascidiaceicola]
MKRALAVTLLVAACAPAGPNVPRSDPIPYTLDANGVQLSDRAQRIDFGRTDHSTIPAMTKLVGRGPTATRDCAGSGQQVEWPDGTALVFAAGEFRGWTNAAASAGLSC